MPSGGLVCPESAEKVLRARASSPDALHDSKSALAHIPGKMMMKTGRTLNMPAMAVPSRASSGVLVEMTRCAISKSRHQYHVLQERARAG